MVRFYFAFVLAVCIGGGHGCVTDEKKNAINGVVQDIIDPLVANGLATQNPTTQQVDVAPASLPALFQTLCNTPDIKAKMEQLATDIGQCQELLLEQDLKLYLLQIGGVGFAQLLVVFPAGVDQFCQCSSGLPSAWVLKADTTTKVYVDPEAAFTTIAHVSNICGNVLKNLIVSVGSASADCKQALKQQAGFANATKFDDYYGIAEDCSPNTANDWDCTNRIAKTSDFKTCINDERNKVGDSALCGKWGCVSTKMHECSNNARKLYIKAVNTENTAGIREDNEGCGVCGLHFSLLAIAACFLLFWL